MKTHFPAFLRVLVFFFAIMAGIELVVDSGDQPAFIKYPITLLFLALALFLLIAIEMIWAAIGNISYQLLSDEQKVAVQNKRYVPIKQREWYQKMMQKLTNTQPLAGEHAILLDHDYDGIRELDNNLPPWWVYSFYATIVFAAVYMVHYELIDGNTQEDEFQAEMAQAKIEVEEYKKTALDLIDEKTVVALTDDASLAKGKEVYLMYCAACHRPDGGGAIGPNLTDAHWILGGGIKNVFQTINNGGRDGKGMVSWKGTLKPSEMQQVASYVLTLQGGNPPDAKEAEGDVYVPEIIAENK